MHAHETKQVSLPKLLFTIFLNLVITTAQVVGGIFSGSLALISDALHNLSDSVSVILAYIAQILSQKPRTQKSTFGYKRAEILAAFLNALALMVISVYLVYEAINRIVKPEEVDARWMFWLGLLGLAANGISVLVLEREKNKNINIKAAYLHLLGDALTSVAVVIGALLIWYFQVIWVDAVVTIIISIYLFVHTLKLLKQSAKILMQMAPPGISIPEIKARLETMNLLRNIHHIHVWNLTDKIIHFECHAELEVDVKISETNKILTLVEKILHDEFGIEHVTIQFEYFSNLDKNCDC